MFSKFAVDDQFQLLIDGVTIRIFVDFHFRRTRRFAHSAHSRLHTEVGKNPLLQREPDNDDSSDD